MEQLNNGEEDDDNDDDDDYDDYEGKLDTSGDNKRIEWTFRDNFQSNQRDVSRLY